MFAVGGRDDFFLTTSNQSQGRKQRNRNQNSITSIQWIAPSAMQSSFWIRKSDHRCSFWDSGFDSLLWLPLSAALAGLSPGSL
jgi:hypothetical protein